MDEHPFISSFFELLVCNGEVAREIRKLEILCRETDLSTEQKRIKETRKVLITNGLTSRWGLGRLCIDKLVSSCKEFYELSDQLGQDEALKIFARRG